MKSKTTYIVAFDRYFYSPYDLCDYLFLNRPTSFPANVIGYSIWNDYNASKNKFLTFDEIVNEIKNGSLTFTAFQQPNRKSINELINDDKFDIDLDRFADAAAYLFVRETPKTYYIKFEYINDGSFGAVLESGLAFEKVPHLRILHS